RTVERVGSRFGGYIHYATRCASIVRRKIAGAKLKLLHGIQRHLLTDTCVEEIDVLRAIQQNVGRGGPLSVDGHTPSAAHTGSVAIADVARCRHKVVNVAG